VIRLLVSAMALMVLVLGYRAWFGDSGYFALAKMEQRVAEQRKATAEIEADNTELTHEVMGLKHTALAVESRARTDLGMIKDGESFFLVVDAD